MSGHMRFGLFCRCFVRSHVWHRSDTHKWRIGEMDVMVLSNVLCLHPRVPLLAPWKLFMNQALSPVRRTDFNIVSSPSDRSWEPVIPGLSASHCHSRLSA
jgi:hypothetical protein